MEQYQYEPLPSPTLIRLIKINPGESSDHFSCSFVVSDFADASNPPKYTALSYVWGDTSRTVSIICENDKVVQITPNLRDALRKWSGTPTLWWIDAISINQQDILERNQQVKLMATIYQKAATVRVWLGHDEDNDAPTIFQAFEELEHGLQIMHKGGGQIRHYDEEAADLHWAFQSMKVNNLSPPAWVPASLDRLTIPWSTATHLPAAIFHPDESEKARLEKFFRLPYFSRTWVMQEIGLASNAVVSWGNNSIDWSIIGLSTMFFMRHCRAHFDKLALSADVERLYHLYTAFSPFTPMATFLHVISNARRYKATDPRDKIFAMLSHPTAHTISITGISLNWAGYQRVLPLAIEFLPSIHDQRAVKMHAERSDKSQSPPRQLPPPLLQADYSKKTEEVYRDMVLDFIDRTKSLEILTAVQHDPEDDTSSLFTPSWVPRWDYFVNTPILGLYNSTHLTSANKEAIITPPPPNIQNTLTVRGTLITRIMHHKNLLESSSFDLSPSPATTSSSPDNSENLWKTNPIAQIWQKYLADVDPDSYPILPLYFANGHAFYDRSANNVYKAYMRTWVAGKNMGEVDNFDLNADSSAYSSAVTHHHHHHHHPEDYPSPPSFESWYHDNNHNNNNIASQEESVEKYQDPEDSRRWKRYRDSAGIVCNKRKFFFSKKGFFGIGPGALRNGDFIAILLGADVPFIIREVLDDNDDDEEIWLRMMMMGNNQPVPMDRKFRLVGECYVDGLMQGQAVKGVEIVRDITLI